MKIAIIGSRDFNNYDDMKKFILDNIKVNEIDSIISGGAKGADKLGELFAKEFKKEITVFLPDWEKYGKCAGMIRNKDIIKNSDIVFAFWDGESKGTKNSIDLSIKLRKKLFVYKFTNN